MTGVTANLESKVIMITGGTSGIGRAVALRAASEGATVVVSGRRVDLGEGVAADIRAAGGRALFVRADVTVEDDVAGLVGVTVDTFGRLDGAFNNAGGVISQGAVDQVADDEWRADLDLNLTSVFYSLKHQVPMIATSGGGAIVNNASIAGVSGVPGMAVYTAAKHGVIGLTRAVALEGAGRGVRVNALVTGNVDTPLYRRLLGAPPTGDVRLDAPNPTGRVAAPEEIAAFVTFLLSDEAAFITGAALAADGGSTAQ
jgi:NAD(P)-dependent dehydrogenase (short-subunit alcohol dehydrogenase family)